MPVRSAPWTIVSMVSEDYVQMYLLGLKSFYAQIGRGQIVAILYKGVTDVSRQLLREHFPGIDFVNLDEIYTGACQRGGTWERLIYILDRAANEYVMQLDCDTLTLGPDIHEVVDCVENNVAFTLSGMGRQIAPMANWVEPARANDSNYIGIEAERLFDRYPNSQNLRYVRASSGFAGFAKGGFPRQRIEEFHTKMEELLGARWKEWGTEQCASNFAVANSEGAVVLPFPKYANFTPGIRPGESSFLHFFGTFRFRGSYYTSLALHVINELHDRN